MLRKLPLAMAIALAVAPLQIQALGLGGIETRSVLNQPFDADIELLSVAAGELDAVKVGLASAEAFARAGVERPFALSRLKFSTERKANGEAIIHVYSNTLVQEPFLNFLVEVNWPKGRVVREFTVLLDPPLTTGKKMSSAPVTPAQVTQTSTRTGRSQQPAAVRGGQSGSMPATAVVDGKYGPVKRNETLWAIADRYRGEGVSVQQMMLAILQANRQAFMANNINTLKAGSVLRIPTTEEVQQISRQQAQVIAADQFRDWKNGNLETQAKQETMQEMAATETDIKAQSAAEAERARLKLSGSDQASSQMATGEDSDAESIRQELLTAQEKIDTSQSEAADLRNQLSTMEQQMADMKRLLELKDEQLAQLQQSLQTEPAETMEAGGAEEPSPAMPEEAEPMTEASDRMEMPAEEVTAPTAEMPAETEQVMRQSGMEEAATQQQEAEAPPKEKNLLDALFGSPIMMGIATAVVVVLAALFWTAFSRRKSNEQLVAEGGVPAKAEPEASADTDVLNTAVEESDEETSFLSEFTPGDMNSLHDDETGEVDPISEADVYIAYGRFDQAEDLVKQALDAEPGKVVYQHKLLEIYYANKDAEKYTALMNSMHEAGAEAEDPDSWNRAKLMGMDLDPENPLYADAMDAPSVDIGDDLDMALSELESQLTEDIDNPLEDLNTPSSEVDDFLSDNEAAQSKPAADEDEIIPLPEVELESSTADVEADESAIDELAAELESFDMENAPPSELVLDAPISEELPDTDDLLLSEDSGSMSDFATELDDGDSVATKIDLAKAYIDMGDKEGAKGILEEVIEEGSDSQKQQAQTMIADMG